MARKAAKLKDALRRHQGKDHALEKQKKLQKLAEKRKRTGKSLEAGDEIDDEVSEEELNGGVPLQDTLEDADLSPETLEFSGSEEEPGNFDISRLNEIDSDSDSDSEDEIPDSNLPPTKSTKSRVTTVGKTVNGGPAFADTPAVEDDIPLSDLSDASDTEDIVPHQRLTINNLTALKRALSSFALPLGDLPFSEHQSITSPEPIKISDVEDEINRELSFYSQALKAAKEARSLLLKEGAPFSRPNDYFAEMVKSDEHMGKIKAKLVDEAASKKASQEARRQRELKKFGKQVQVEKLKERAKQKRDMLDKVKILKRKRQSNGLEDTNEQDMFDVALEDAATSERKAKEDRRAKAKVGGRNSQQTERNAKRQKRDERFGFGGKKRFKKSGDTFSSADMGSYSTKRMKAQGGPAKKTAPKRLGKSRRAKTR